MWAALARLILKVAGWTVVGELPKVDKAVLIGAPHTSNWDGIWGMVWRVSTGTRINFFAKRSLFWFPLNCILRILGGVPIDRDRAGGAVQQAIDLINTHSPIIFGLSPEGTRRNTEYWKSGFYRIAEATGVPVILGFFDYQRKRIGVGSVLHLTGDRDADLDVIRKVYEAFGGPLYPEKVGPIKFRPE